MHFARSGQAWQVAAGNSTAERANGKTSSTVVPSALTLIRVWPPTSISSAFVVAASS